jgi:S-DNA-T family DNA segregation ATPase FtsK/SpoIIIE
LIDQMADAGVVGEFKGSQAREVVMTLEEWDELIGSTETDRASEIAAETYENAPEDEVDAEAEDEYEDAEDFGDDEEEYEDDEEEDEEEDEALQH